MDRDVLIIRKRSKSEPVQCKPGIVQTSPNIGELDIKQNDIKFSLQLIDLKYNNLYGTLVPYLGQYI